MSLWRVAQMILQAIFDFRGHMDAKFREINDKLDAQNKILLSIQNAVEPAPAATLKLTIGKPVPK